MTTNTRLADLLRAERDRRGLSQRELAALSGVDQRRISSFERRRRRPSLDQMDKLLAGLGLQLRFETEPLWADVDAAIDQLAEKSMPERLRTCPVMVLMMLDWFSAAAPVVDGAVAALLQGAPVPAKHLDLCITEDRLEQLATAMHRFPPVRWHAGKEWFISNLDYDPRSAGAMRWRSHMGEFRLRVVAHAPRSLRLVVDDTEIAVRPLSDIELDDADLARVLARARQRSRRPAGSGEV